VPDELRDTTRDVDSHQSAGVNEIVEDFLRTLLVHCRSSLQHDAQAAFPPSGISTVRENSSLLQMQMAPARTMHYAA